MEGLTDELLTVNEVAEILKLKAGTVYEYLNDGRLSGIKLGGKSGKGSQWRVKRSELEKFVENYVEEGESNEIETTKGNK